MLNRLRYKHAEDIPPKAFLVPRMPAILEGAHRRRCQLLFSLDQVANCLTLVRMSVHLKEAPETLRLKECGIEREARGDADKRFPSSFGRLPEIERLCESVVCSTPPHVLRP